MHHGNHFYGHAHVLARYCGQEEPPPIRGYLQHGWNILDGYAVGTDFAPGGRLFVWSQSVMRRGWTMGRRGYEVIGAPFAYLLKVRADEVQAALAAPREGVLFYPFHGWEGQEVVGDHGRLRDELMETEGDVPITVCLYWNEYKNREIRKVYQDRDLNVICHGYRGLHWRDTDVLFLDKQLDALLSVRKVVSNRLSSAVFYGGAVGCEVGVYGDPMVLEDEDPAFGGQARIKRLWPELIGTHISSELAHRHARIELGMDALLAPNTLATRLGWPAAQRQESVAS